MNPTDPTRLREGKEKAERATPQPWHLEIAAELRLENIYGPPAVDWPRGHGLAFNIERFDTAYIVHVANDYPALARAHLELLEAVEQADGYLADPCGDPIASINFARAALAAGSAIETEQE